MPDFIVETPEGKFKVTAPDPESAAKGFQAFKTGGSFGGPAASSEPKYTPEEEAYLNDRTKRLGSRDTNTIAPEALRDLNEQAMGATPFGNTIFDASSALFDGPKDASWSRTYELNREARRRRTEGVRERSPVASAAGEIIGGVGTLGMSSGAPATGIIGRMTSPATGGSAAGRLAENTVNAGLVSGAQSAVQEYGYGGNAGDAFGTGAAIGAAVPGLVSGARLVGGLVREVAQPIFDPAAAAARKFMERAVPEGRDAASLVNRAREAGGGAMPIDFARDAGRTSLRAAINSGVKEGDDLKAKLGLRQLGAPGRVSQSLTEHTGADPLASQGALDIRMEQMREGGRQAYDAANAAARPVDLTRTINVIDEALGPAAQASGGSTLRDTPIERRIRSIRDTIANAQEQRFDLPTLHRYVKREIDSAVEAARNPISGDRTLARELQQISDQFVADLGADNELYNVARRQWAGDAQAIDAYTAGLDFFSSKGSRLTREEMARFSQADREMLKQGMVRSVQDWVEQGVDGADVARRIMGSPARRQALSELFDTPAEQARFMRDLLNEARFARTRSKAIGGSQTDELGKAGQDGAMTPNDGIAALVSPSSGLMTLVKRAAAAAQGFPPGVAREFIRLATDTSMSGARRSQELLRIAQGRRDLYDQLNNALLTVSRPTVGSATQDRQ